MDFGVYCCVFIVVIGLGEVVYVGWRGGYGCIVEIDYGYGFCICYVYFYEIVVCWGDIVE